MAAIVDDDIDVVYTAPPIAAQFHRSPADVRGIRGPLGSGKSTSCAFELFIQAQRIAPCKDGVRRSRLLIVRNTYSDLKSTTIKTWESWFGADRGPGFGAIVYDTPIRQHIRLDRADGGVEIEVWFLALDRPDHVKKLKSMDVTWVWLNEASELPKALLDMATARAGRFPYAHQRPDDCHPDQWPSRYGVIMDTNSMDDDHWWYRLAEVEKPKGYAFFDQPGGLDPAAENIEHLPGGRNYYHRLTQGRSDAWVKVFVRNQYGAVADGRPVYPEFNEHLHVAKAPLQVLRGLPVRLGFDFGLTPACAVMQLSPRGQLRILREFVTEGDTMGIRRFASEVVLPALQNEFSDLEWISRGDPGGAQRTQTDEDTCINDLTEIGIQTEAASTNFWSPRREALAHFMTRLVDGQPALQVDPSCKYIRKGLNGAYRYRRLAVAGEERYTDVPDKNKWSHICEAAQYAALDVVAELSPQRRRSAVRSRARPRRALYGY